MIYVSEQQNNWVTQGRKKKNTTRGLCSSFARGSSSFPKKFEQKGKIFRSKMPTRMSSKRKLEIGELRSMGSVLEEKKLKTRNGIIPYTIYKGERYFLFGFDSRTFELTDFGGGYKSTDGTRIKAAIREFQEETLSIFEEIAEEDLGNCIAIADSDNLIIFVPLEIDPKETCFLFEQEVKKFHSNTRGKLPEVSGVTWLRENELLNCITRQDSSETIYKKVGTILRRASRSGNSFIRLL